MTARESQTLMELADVKDLLQKLVTALVDEPRETARRKEKAQGEVYRMWMVSQEKLLEVWAAQREDL